MVSVEETANKWLARHNERAMRWRHDLHAHPELSNEEHRTTQLLVDVLRAEGLDPVRFPHTGLYVDLGPTKGERVAFRAEDEHTGVVAHKGLPLGAALDPLGSPKGVEGAVGQRDLNGNDGVFSGVFTHDREF